MSTNNRHRRRRSAVALIAVFLLTLVAVPSVAADSTAQTLPFSPGLARHDPDHVTDDWSGVPGVVGLPWTGHHDGDGRRPADAADRLDVRERRRRHRQHPARRQYPERRRRRIRRDRSSRTRSSRSSPTAPPTRRTSSSICRRPAFGTSRSAYDLRDIDDTIDNAIQPVALQFRVGSSGHMDERACRVRRRRHDRPEPRDTGDAGQRRAPLTARTTARCCRSGSSPPMQSRNDEWVGIDDISVDGIADRQAAGCRVDLRRATAPLTLPSTRTSR